MVIMETKAAKMEEVRAASDGVQLAGPIMDEWDPWNPPYPPCRPAPPNLDLKSHALLIREWYHERNEVIAASRRNNIIIPDRTPQAVDDAFYDELPSLLPILEKDSVRRFLTLFRQVGCGSMAWGFIITPLTFTQMVKQNALQCAKVALEGKAPELCGFRANPNCMNRYGYFPLHQAAEMFSIDMVKLLFIYGASAMVRTAGAEVIEDLLPLHVAVENTCLHKYLEDNAFPDQEDLENSQANLNYICKLIHLLCLPEMKIFLDTTRLLAENTDNIVDQVWNYIKDGKLVQTAVLLLAAQEQIRGGPSCKITGKNGNSKQDGFSIKSSSNKNGNGKQDGFSIIINRILTHTISLVVQTETGKNRKKNKGLEKEKKLTSAALLLVRAILKVGEDLDAYIRSHPEVPHNMRVSHNEVHEHVSAILKDGGFVLEKASTLETSAPMRMYCPKKSCLRTMGICSESRRVVNIQQKRKMMSTRATKNASSVFQANEARGRTKASRTAGKLDDTPSIWISTMQFGKRRNAPVQGL